MLNGGDLGEADGIPLREGVSVAIKRGNARTARSTKGAASKSESKKSAARRRSTTLEDPLRDVPSQPFLEEQLHGQTVKAAPQRRPALAQGRVPSVASVAKRIKRVAPVPVKRLPAEITQSVRALEPPRRSIHGSKFSLAYFRRCPPVGLGRGPPSRSAPS